jgi:CheY-like chemotaxis protein
MLTPLNTPSLPANAPNAPLDDREQLARNDAHLLVIEDDAAFAMALGEVIHGQGLKFVIASNGKEGLKLAKERKPSGVILDVRLPDVDGFAVMEALRADPDTAAIPVHFVSALEAGERGMALGAVGYLTKPVSQRDLVRMVESVAPKHAQRAYRVLIVEDDVPMGDSLMQRLQSDEIDARRVTSARAALKLLKVERFGCIVLDLSLPDMDGLDFLNTLREQCEGQVPPVIVHTGRPLSKAETQKLEAHAEAVVLKEGSGIERLLDEIRLFARRLREGLPPSRRVALPAQPVPLRIEGKKLLLVDDDMRTVYALSAVLRAKGAEVFVADNGQAALDELDKHRDVDLVLMDIMMPEMDGYEAIRRIRANPAFGALPIIALTAKAMKGDREKCIEVGATDYLPKPVDPDGLARVLHARLIGGAQGNGAAHA